MLSLLVCQFRFPCVIAYIVMPHIGFTMNMLVMFAFIFALGIVVDDAIVVIENTHRIFKQGKGKLSIIKAAKMAAGEVFVPILVRNINHACSLLPSCFLARYGGQIHVCLFP